jgi:hypothetical protein
MNNQFINLMDDAFNGANILIVGSKLRSRTISVGRGMVHFRNHNPSGLKSVPVDIVWFVEYPPYEVERLCRERTRASRNPVFLCGENLLKW